MTLRELLEEEKLTIAFMLAIALIIYLYASKEEGLRLSCSDPKHVRVLGVEYYDDGDFKRVEFECVGEAGK